MHQYTKGELFIKLDRSWKADIVNFGHFRKATFSRKLSVHNSSEAQDPKVAKEQQKGEQHDNFAFL